MSHLSRCTLALVVTGLVAGAAFITPPPAEASTLSTTPSAHVMQNTTLTPDTIDRAIAEARSSGGVLRDTVQRDGSHVVTIGSGDGITLDLVEGNPTARLSTSTDQYGRWIGFNSYDQSVIIGGGGLAISTGLCLLGPVVCVVAEAAMILVAAAVTQNGGVQCGTKSLRVYPWGGHKPRCA
ncbi:hypothetical protein [Frondihabitans peucedani]|uniref:Uncharacterized protein n=1 Tax=Frondihabitans peucedani TaxID=598626 RepID=A0ABP8E4V1_9MICO